MCFQKLGRASKNIFRPLNPVGIVRGPLPPRAHFHEAVPQPEPMSASAPPEVGGRHIHACYHQHPVFQNIPST